MRKRLVLMASTVLSVLALGFSIFSHDKEVKLSDLVKKFTGKHEEAALNTNTDPAYCMEKSVKNDNETLFVGCNGFF